MTSSTQSLPVLDYSLSVLTPDHAIGTIDRVLVVIFRKETTMRGVTQLLQTHEQLAKERPGGFGLFTIVEANAPAPPGPVRDALAAYMKDGGAHIRSSAVTYEGSGFRAAMIRSVVAGLQMIAHQPFPHRVFATIDEAAIWISGSLKESAGMVMDAHAFATRLQAMRRRISERSSDA